MEYGEYGIIGDFVVDPPTVGRGRGPEHGVVTIQRHLKAADVAMDLTAKKSHAIKFLAQHVCFMSSTYLI